MAPPPREPDISSPDGSQPLDGELSSTLSTTQQRKVEHIRINLEEDVQSKGISSGLDRYRLVHMALPELNLKEVDTATTFLGHRLRAPVLVSCMTGGVERGREINQRLARAAQAHGCAMGVGSQRAAIEDPALAPLFRVRDVAPDILLLANLGAAQLNYGYGIDHCRRAVAMIDADALALHLNPLQEALQPDGNVNFSGLLSRIERVCRALEVPVIVKEVGWGISAPVARQLAEVGVAAIDVAGAGGTSWSEVEHHRAPTPLRRRISGTFIAWGIPTAESLLMARQGAPGLPLIASGGLRHGIDAAKTIALGADLAGFASPLLKAAAESEDAVNELMSGLIEELRISMFCCGVRDLAGLRQVEIVEQLPAASTFGPEFTYTGR
ncbi:MAG TPA: type 2 isopentenyl-diphosphate Delta-isomerase [Gemmatimonadales bacterium]|nr:type 2 isopentenyl-diphosphate Delta-isomerase [Gemmatimonadales bacterium]